MYIPVILGTARIGRRSENVAKFVLAETKKFGLETELIDVRDYHLQATDNTKESEQAKKLAAILAKADGLIIVAPEYNHGYPGELKMMLDLLQEEYYGLPVSICGVSSGGFGGTRMAEQLFQICHYLGMLTMHEIVHFPKVQDLFDEKGTIKDASYSERVQKMLDELKTFAEKLK